MDNTQLKILTTIQEEVRTKKGKEFGIELGVEEIDNIKDFQFFGLVLGISKQIDVHLPKMGKFVFTNRKKRQQEKKEVLTLLKHNKEVNPDFDREAALKVFVKQWALDTEEAKSIKDTNEKSLDEVLDAPTITNPNIRIFGRLGNLIKR